MVDDDEVALRDLVQGLGWLARVLFLALEKKTAGSRLLIGLLLLCHAVGIHGDYGLFQETGSF